MAKRKHVRKSVRDRLKLVATAVRKVFSMRRREVQIEKGFFVPKNKIPEDQQLINRMTNWQRNQWAKAGYPKDLDKIAHFSSLQRRSH